MGATWHADLPWDLFKKKFHAFRAKYFSSDPPKRWYIHVDITKDELLLKLGSRSYAPDGSLFSYDKGEDINMAKVTPIAWEHLTSDMQEKLKPYLDEDERSVTWWQTHLRGWEVEEGHWKLNGHWELEPVMNDSAHIDEIGYSDKRGLRNIVYDLEESNINITEYPEFMR